MITTAWGGQNIKPNSQTVLGIYTCLFKPCISWPVCWVAPMSTFLPTYQPTYVPIDVYRSCPSILPPTLPPSVRLSIRLSFGQSINPLIWLILFKGHPPGVYTWSTKLQLHRSYDVSSASAECLKENRHGLHHLNLELESDLLLVWIPASLRSKFPRLLNFYRSQPQSPTPRHPQKPTSIYPSSKLLAMPTR